MAGLDVQGRMELLRASPALAGFLREPESESILRALAKRLRPSPLEANTSLTALPPALRFIVSGRVRVARYGRLLPGNSQHLGEGSVHGLQHVATWLEPGASHRSLAATTVTPTDFLELRQEDFEHVPRPLFEWLLRVAQAQEVAEELVRALGQEPRFANVSEQALFRLAESASLVSEDTRTLLSRGSIPGDFHVLLAGTCRILRSGECIALLKAPACIGHKQFLLKQPMAGDAVLEGSQADRPRVLRIDGASFSRLRGQDPGFQRALLRGNPELSPKPTPPATHQVLVLDSHEPFPLRRLGDLLAERLAVHLQEHVHVLRAVKGNSPQEPPHFRQPPGAVNGWVAESARRVPAPDDSVPFLPRPDDFTWVPLEHGPAGRINVTLVDLSDLEPPARSRMLQRLARELEPYPDEPLRLIYVSSRPNGYPRADSLPERARLVPTGVLSPTLPVGIQPTLRQAFTEKPLAERLSTLRKALTGARDLASAMGSHLRDMLKPAEPEATWPLGTVRVRFPSPWRLGDVPPSVSFSEEPALRETFDRWARAVTDRRVGLALGGGGAFGYVHLALLERLMEPPRTGATPGTPEEAESLRVPVDMISGSSFGTVVGAFYCVAGKQGLELMKNEWPMLAAAVPFGVVTSVGIQWILDAILGPVKLEQLEVPLFPVVVDADAGVEWDVRQGTVGYGIRASGSFPPAMGPLISLNRRLLDGGFVANVPVNVLRTEGAGLLIASNPIPRVAPRNRTFPRLRLLGALWRQVNPLLRVEDSYRMLTLIGRVAGESQSRAEGMVVYRPKYNSGSLVGMNKGARVSEEAEQSLELGQAILEARALWRSRLNNPVSRIRWDAPSSPVVLNEPVLFDGAHLDPVSQRTLLAELVDFLQHRKSISAFTIVATGLTRHEADARARALRDYLIESCVPQPPEQVKSRGEVLAQQPGPGSRVTLEVESGQVASGYAMRMEESWREQKELARRALADAQARRLHLASERQGRTGDPDLARLLALEAVRLDRSAETDRALRAVLDRRGTLLRHFQAEVSALCLSWSPDGQQLVVGYKDGALRLWDVAREEPLWDGMGHEGGTDVATNTVAWAPSGQVLASTGNDSQLVLWSPTPEGLVPRQSEYVNTWNHWGLAFSPSGGHLLAPFAASEFGKRYAAVLQLSRRGTLSALPGENLPEFSIESAAWAPDTRSPRFATVDKDSGKVAVWSVSKAGVERHQEFSFPGARRLAWKPDGEALVVGGAGGACILRPGTRTEPLRLDTHGLEVERVEWSSDGKRVLATISEGGTLYVWDASGALLTVIRVETEGLLQEVRCHPTRPEVALTWGGEAACVWDVSTGRQLAWLGGHTGKINEARWSTEGARVATASHDGSVRIWEPFGGGPERYPWSAVEEQRTPVGSRKRFHWPSEGLALPLDAGESGRVWVSSPTPGGERIVPVRSPRDGRLVLKPWRRGKPLPAGALPEWTDAISLHWSPDGSQVALREPECISLWDATTWKLRAEYAPSGLGATRVAWDRSGKRLAIGRFVAGWSAVMLWEPAREPEPVPLEGAQESDGVWDLAWSPDGRQLATACNDSYVRVYSVPRRGASANLVLSIHHWFAPYRVAWNPRGDLLACGDESGAVEIWNIEGRDLVASPQLRRKRIRHLVWSPNGAHLFSADMNGRALLWGRNEEDAWVTAAVLDTEPARLHWAAFSEDGAWVLAMEHDGRVRLHPVDLDTLAGRVAERPGRKELTPAERAQYLGGGASAPSPAAASAFSATRRRRGSSRP
ncbi:patatin-like phospholipase family protein [Hyalangium rubrum]|uniref:Patatin-like phospholipase family protein n=1 Tax=Hyalangium rubrum TaxID=3103134 RepID=A0ABU5H9J0_9BACT|nr:patatin-like phospholipase family protein [Hyalangium sp. s54d21]MDY7230151.1 patatin-like phospholipase family protein [Hyalangium sp. s54d21]